MLKALFFRDDIDIYVCDELLREFCEVSKRSKIQKYISIRKRPKMTYCKNQ